MGECFGGFVVIGFEFECSFVCCMCFGGIVLLGVNLFEVNLI